MLRQATVPHYVLTHMRESTLVNLTQTLRDEVIIRELEPLGDKAGDARIRVQDRDWLNRIVHSKSVTLRAATLNDSDKWAFMKACDYGGRLILKMCAPRRRAELSRWVISAYVFQDEISELIDAPWNDSRSIVDMIAAAWKLRKQSKPIAEAFKAAVSESEWSALEMRLAPHRGTAGDHFDY